MAAPSPVPKLPSEASCPICLEYFRDPVSIHCGHNFCRACITRCWEWSTANFSCPQCKETAPERSFRPSRELARVLEIAKRLSLQAARGDVVEEEGCERHREPLNIFCKDDETFICVICRESRLHRAHTMLPEMNHQCRTLLPHSTPTFCVPFSQEKTEAERQKVLSTFEGLRLFLEDQARHLLAQLAELERAVEKMQEENITNLTKEISHLDTLIQEMEEKCQEPASKFLQPTLLLPELENKISHFREKNIALEETLRNFKGRAWGHGEMFWFPFPVNVTLDPATAHPQLAVSEDRRSVRWEDAQQDASDEGFGPDPSVLGCEGITSGRCCWEVEVTPKGSWAVGVARESLKRREETPVSPEIELWSMGLCEDQFWALTSFERTPLSQIQVPRRVRITLDYERGQVAFFDVDRKALIFIFSAASFKGESVHPWFLVWSEGSRITLCP
uniref:Zinc finger protein RFP-like n=1 Tax=Anas zonorhyncha TaxID=75864 RepID=A0A8B9ZPK3_9AVES